MKEHWVSNTLPFTIAAVARSSAVQVGLIAGGVVMSVILTVTIPLVTVMFIYTRFVKGMAIHHRILALKHCIMYCDISFSVTMEAITTI